jgi:hypothetical protein
MGTIAADDEVAGSLQHRPTAPAVSSAPIILNRLSTARPSAHAINPPPGALTRRTGPPRTRVDYARSSQGGPSQRLPGLVGSYLLPWTRKGVGVGHQVLLASQECCHVRLELAVDICAYDNATDRPVA